MGEIGIVIVNYRTAELTVDCIASIEAERAALPGLRLVVVDGHSEDGSAGRIAEALKVGDRHRWGTLLPLEVNGGFGFANNQAIAALTAAGAPPRHICLINPDARVEPGALSRLAALLDTHPAAGAAGALLIDEEGGRQGSAFAFPSVRGGFARGARTGALDRLVGAPPTVVEATHARRVDWVTGAAVMFRTDALAEVGLFDDGFFLYFEETELLHRLARAGWEIWHEPAARVLHLGGRATQIRDVSTGDMLAKRLPRYWYDSQRRYFVRTGGPARAVAAGLAWLAGHGLWRLRCLLTGRRDDTPAYRVRDFVAHGWWPRRQDRRAAALPRLGDGPAARPLWMTHA